MDELVGDFRRYDEGPLVELVRSAGLTVRSTTFYGWPLAYALEGVRNRLDTRKREQVHGHAPEELSAASGRTFQPGGSLSGRLVEIGALPFCYLQRARPRTGTGLVLVASVD
jgi:hypothetical protein